MVLRLSRGTFPKHTEGTKLQGKYLTLVWGASLPGGCAVVVSKKVAKRSVDRHLLKRRLMHVLHPWAQDGHFMVVYAKSGSASRTFSELSEELTSLLMKTGLSVRE